FLAALKSGTVHERSTGTPARAGSRFAVETPDWTPRQLASTPIPASVTRPSPVTAMAGAVTGVPPWSWRLRSDGHLLLDQFGGPFQGVARGCGVLADLDSDLALDHQQELDEEQRVHLQIFEGHVRLDLCPVHLEAVDQQIHQRVVHGRHDSSFSLSVAGCSGRRTEVRAAPCAAMSAVPNPR